MKKMIAFTLASVTLGTALIGTVGEVQADTSISNQTVLNVNDNFSRPAVTLFTGIDGTGRSHTAFESESSLFGNVPWLNDNVASIRLSPRSKVVVYEDTGFNGGFRTFINTQDIEITENLPGSWGDRVSSFQLSSYTDSDFGINLSARGGMLGDEYYRITEPQSNFDLSENNFDNRVTSLELYPNTGIIMFDQPGLRGEFAVFENKGPGMMYVDVRSEAPHMVNQVSSYSAYRLP